MTIETKGGNAITNSKLPRPVGGEEARGASVSPRLRHPLGAEHGRQSVLARLAGCLAVRDHMSA
jgi:hypothetical protein